MAWSVIRGFDLAKGCPANCVILCTFIMSLMQWHFLQGWSSKHEIIDKWVDAMVIFQFCFANEEFHKTNIFRIKIIFVSMILLSSPLGLSLVVLAPLLRGALEFFLLHWLQLSCATSFSPKVLWCGQRTRSTNVLKTALMEFRSTFSGAEWLAEASTVGVYTSAG